MICSNEYSNKGPHLQKASGKDSAKTYFAPVRKVKLESRLDRHSKNVKVGDDAENPLNTRKIEQHCLVLLRTDRKCEINVKNNAQYVEQYDCNDTRPYYKRGSPDRGEDAQIEDKQGCLDEYSSHGVYHSDHQYQLTRHQHPSVYPGIQT